LKSTTIDLLHLGAIRSVAAVQYVGVQLVAVWARPGQRLRLLHPWLPWLAQSPRCVSRHLAGEATRVAFDLPIFFGGSGGRDDRLCGGST
jgi:hypothetical protein